jgi:hypothetical protein
LKYPLTGVGVLFKSEHSSAGNVIGSVHATDN